MLTGLVLRKKIPHIVSKEERISSSHEENRGARVALTILG